MKTRLLPAAAIVLLLISVAPAAQSGEVIVLQMKGDLAKEYAKATQGAKLNDNVRIEVIATVAQRLPDGRLRIEHSASGIQKENAPTLVTLTATVSPSAIHSEVTPKGTKVYASPGSKESTETTKQTELLHVTLSDLKGLKLRTWTLASQIGE